MTTVFIDCETTGLSLTADPWEIAVIVEGHSKAAYDGEWLWQVRPDLSKADPGGLRISRFYERFLLDQSWPGRVDAALIESPMSKLREVASPSGVARWVATLVNGAVWVGAVPGFDEIRLGRWVRRQGYCLSNHYQTADVETAVAGYLSAKGDVQQPPWNSRELLEKVGVTQEPGAEHTALGDARWARDAYRVVFPV